MFPRTMAALPWLAVVGGAGLGAGPPTDMGGEAMDGVGFAVMAGGGVMVSGAAIGDDTGASIGSGTTAGVVAPEPGAGLGVIVGP